MLQRGVATFPGLQRLLHEGENILDLDYRVALELAERVARDVLGSTVSPEGPEDVAVIAVLELDAKIEKGVLVESERGALSSLAFWRARDALKRNLKEIPMPMLEWPHNAVDDEASGASVDDGLVSTTIYEAVEELSPRQREAFVLTQLRGLTMEETSELLGLSNPRSINSAAQPARRRVQQRIMEVR